MHANVGECQLGQRSAGLVWATFLSDGQLPHLLKDVACKTNEGNSEEVGS